LLGQRPVKLVNKGCLSGFRLSDAFQAYAAAKEVMIGMLCKELLNFAGSRTTRRTKARNGKQKTTNTKGAGNRHILKDAPLTFDPQRHNFLPHPLAIGLRELELKGDAGIRFSRLGFLTCSKRGASKPRSGQNAAEYPDIVRRIAAEGHEIGNHTWNHPN
jgi:Polysaccharide deacetylase